MTKSNIEITQAKPSDVESIVALSYALFQEDAGQRDPTVNLEWAKEEGDSYFSDFIATPVYPFSGQKKAGQVS